MDKEVKEKASFILDEIGLSVSDAIRLFFKQIIMKRGMPFPVRIPNSQTITAMNASDKGKGVEEVTLSQLHGQFKAARKKIIKQKKKA